MLAAVNGLVYMNHGRWVVDCTTEGCRWAYLAVDPVTGKPRYFHRCDGGPDSAHRGCGRRIDLVWPPLDACLEIERLLFARPSAANRNWRFPETVEGLSAENETLLVGWTIADLAREGIGVV